MFFDLFLMGKHHGFSDIPKVLGKSKGITDHIRYSLDLNHVITVTMFCIPKPKWVISHFHVVIGIPPESRMSNLDFSAGSKR
jgi:hypothetical protein